MNGYCRLDLDRGGLPLAFHLQEGAGPAVVFQHGLCGDARQPAEVFPAGTGFRHAVLDCRGQGESPAGDLTALSIATFTEDLAAAIARFALGPCVVGGISMGAAIALRLAVTRPDLCRGLILARPAWVDADAPPNMAPNLAVGRVLTGPETPGERDAFLQTPLARGLTAEAPDNLASLAGFFDRPPRAVTAALLTRISGDGPSVTPAQIAAIRLPTCVIGHDRDAIHPLSVAQRLADLIPGARLVRITPKAADRARYTAEFRTAIADYLKDDFHAQT